MQLGAGTSLFCPSVQFPFAPFHHIEGERERDFHKHALEHEREEQHEAKTNILRSG